ncbi:MAG: OmpA family protein [Cytophagaceae bacterium]
MKTFIILSLFSLIPLATAAKNEKINIKKTEKAAQGYFLSQNYKKALNLYLELEPYKENDFNFNFRVGICYLHSSTKNKAIQYLENARKLTKHKYDHPEVNYYLAIAYHYDYEFVKAINLYKEYKKILDPSDPIEAEEIQHVNLRINQCTNGQKLVKNPVDAEVTIVNSAINCPYADFSPFISINEQTIYFASQRPSTELGNKVAQDTDDYYSNIYIADQSEGKWQNAYSMSGEVNSSFHDKPTYATADGTKLIINRTVNHKTSKILISELESGKWSYPKELGGEINNNSWNSGGCLSPDGKKLFFASDRQGGYGGMDIYVSELQNDGTWGKAKNLGPNINTKYNEEAPFIHYDGQTLYFVSEGHTSMGGYDIFKSEHIKDKWNTPHNLGYPINSPDDETGISWTADGKTGYYSTIREAGYGNEDIMMIKYRDENSIITSLPPLKAGIVELKEEVEEATHVIIPSANEVECKKMDVKIFKAGDYLSEKVHFPFNEYESITEYSKKRLENVIKVLQENPKLKLNLCGYTDQTGNVVYNKYISEKRAKTVYNYLVSQGISPERLKVTSLGCSNPVIDIPSPHVKNRRVEFQIISF